MINPPLLNMLREQGLNIIPLKEQSKVPQINWKKYQDEKFTGEILDKANIGIICGKTSDNLFVVDLDFNDELVLDKIYPDAKNKTLVVKTKKGFHLYFKDEKLPNTLRLENKEIGRIDVQSSGAYVVGPGSIHPDTKLEYQIISKTTQIAKIDFQQIMERLKNLGFNAEQNRQSITEIKNNGVKEGSRNHSMFKVACELLHHRELDEQTAWAELQTINEKNNPPLPQNELEILFNSAKNYGVKTTLDKKGLTGSRKTKQTVKKVKGKVDNLYVESILVDGNPYFLCKSLATESVFLREFVETEDQIIRPPESYECGYFPYYFMTSEIESIINSKISREELLDQIKNNLDRFLSMDELKKHLVLGDILLTFCQEWISTLHFPFFVGETESGKSTALYLAMWLCYRCHLGVDIPSADIYNFLGMEEEGLGTIAEDEAQELWRNPEKLRMYKSSYSKGSKKARIVGVDTLGKHQVFYNTFCPKWFAGEKVPTDKGFLERIAVVHMMEGQPQSNIKRPSEDEVYQLHRLRNRLLVWKVQNIGIGLERIDSGLKQRDQELWEDFLVVVNGTKYFDKCKEVVEYYTDQRHQAIRNSLEARLFGLVVNKLDKNLELKFEDYWNHITSNNSELPGKLDDRNGKTFHPEEFGATITPQLLAGILRDKFQATKNQARIRNEDRKQHQVTTYAFKKETILKLATKYGVELPIDSPSYVGSLGSQDSQV